MKRKYNLSKIMKRAWELVKKAGFTISAGLRKAWKESKGMTEEQKIEALEKIGFKRWTKGSFDRLYINAGQLGLVCEYYPTGNIKRAYFQGEGGYSNNEARRMKAAKTFIDVRTWTVYGDNDTMKAAAEKLMSEAIA